MHQLQRVQFHNGENMRVKVTDWVSGVQKLVRFKRTFTNFWGAVSDEFEKESFRIYILISPEFKWRSRIILNDENFMQYINRERSFARPKILKLYITHSDVSPDGSPAEKKAEGNPKTVDDKSETSSHGTGRSGQSEFSASVRWRDENTCVFCGLTDDGKLEA